MAFDDGARDLVQVVGDKAVPQALRPGAVPTSLESGRGPSISRRKATCWQASSRTPSEPC